MIFPHIHQHHETCFVNNCKLSIYRGYFFIANLVKFYKIKFLEHMLADNQSYLMSKFVNFNPFPDSRMYFEPISPLTPLYTFSAMSEKNAELLHNFVLLSRFFWRILYSACKEKTFSFFEKQKTIVQYISKIHFLIRIHSKIN
jgi:hypothetical protein